MNTSSFVEFALPTMVVYIFRNHSVSVVRKYLIIVDITLSEASWCYSEIFQKQKFHRWCSIIYTITRDKLKLSIIYFLTNRVLIYKYAKSEVRD